MTRRRQLSIWLRSCPTTRWTSSRPGGRWICLRKKKNIIWECRITIAKMLNSWRKNFPDGKLSLMRGKSFGGKGLLIRSNWWRSSSKRPTRRSKNKSPLWIISNRKIRNNSLSVRSIRTLIKRTTTIFHSSSVHRLSATITFRSSKMTNMLKVCFKRLRNWMANWWKNNEKSIISKPQWRKSFLNPIFTNSWISAVRWMSRRIPLSCKRNWPAVNWRITPGGSWTIRRRSSSITRRKTRESLKLLNSQSKRFKESLMTRTNNWERRRESFKTWKNSSIRWSKRTAWRSKSFTRKLESCDPRHSWTQSTKWCPRPQSRTFTPLLKPKPNFRNIKV